MASSHREGTWVTVAGKLQVCVHHILVAATETDLCPGDLIRLSRNQIVQTPAWRRLRAGLSLAQIAACMGWSIRTAALMIERYAKVLPEETDEVLAALAAAK